MKEALSQEEFDILRALVKPDMVSDEAIWALGDEDEDVLHNKPRRRCVVAWLYRVWLQCYKEVRESMPKFTGPKGALPGLRRVLDIQDFLSEGDDIPEGLMVAEHRYFRDF